MKKIFMVLTLCAISFNVHAATLIPAPTMTATAGVTIKETIVSYKLKIVNHRPDWTKNMDKYKAQELREL